MSLEQIQQECRRVIEEDAAKRPGCLRGGFAPAAARALLKTFENLELVSDGEITADEAMEYICEAWEEGV